MSTGDRLRVRSVVGGRFVSAVLSNAYVPPCGLPLPLSDPVTRASSLFQPTRPLLVAKDASSLCGPLNANRVPPLFETRTVASLLLVT